MVEKKKDGAKGSKNVITSYKAYMKKYLPNRYAREEKPESSPRNISK
jgi:hypothetical protein